MKKHLLKYLLLVLIALFTEISLTSCHSDSTSDPTPAPTPTPTPKPDPTPSIVGEWLENNSTEGVISLFTSKYEDDGTYSQWLGYIMMQYNFNINYIGTYTLSDNALTLKYYDSAISENTTENFDVRSLDKYTLIRYWPEGSATIISHRIIDTYYLTVGDEKEIIINDNEFVPISYNSTDQRVATVKKGIITAKKRGTSFVSVSSSIGSAVIRVVVSDPENVFDDYLEYLDSTIEEVTNEFGTVYFDSITYKGDKVRQFNQLDEVVKSVAFYYDSEKIVGTIIADIRHDVNENVITKALEKKYELADKRDGTYYYRTEKDGQEVTIVWSPTDYYHVSYQFKYRKSSKGAYEDYDNLILLTAEEAAKQLNCEITDEDWETECFVKILGNDLFNSVTVSFDVITHDVTQVRLECSGLTRDDVEDWYKDHYFSTGDDKYPYANFDLNGKDKNGNHILESNSYRIRFSIGRRDGATYVVYDRGGVPQSGGSEVEDDYASILESFDKLAVSSLSDIAAALNYELSEDEKRMRIGGGTITIPIINNKLFSSVIINYPGLRSLDNETIRFVCVEGINKSEIERWYKEHYNEGTDGYQFQKYPGGGGLMPFHNLYIDIYTNYNGMISIVYETRIAPAILDVDSLPMIPFGKSHVRVKRVDNTKTLLR